MKKKYPFFLIFAIICMGVFFTPIVLSAQEVKIFSRNDFDLKGNVKSCLVITSYGKEEYNFSPNGLLTKSVTLYNDSDSDITFYKYSEGHLAEKRVESYRDEKLDKNTSLAHIYKTDTTTSTKKISETVFSYNKEFLDRYEYEYDSINRLTSIRQMDNEGVDETRIEYTTFNDETTKTYFFNEVIQKSIRISHKKGKDNSENRIELTKEFLGGDPTKATEQIYSADGRLLSKEQFIYDTVEGEFVSQEKSVYSYDDTGMLTEEKIKTPKTESNKVYIYQFDGTENGNWVKRIITPENSYTTRRIKYYPAEVPKEEMPKS